MKDIRIELRNLLNTFLTNHPGSEPELARELRVSVPTIKRWAKGESAPHPFGCKPVIEYLKKKLSAGP
ncbi:MAG: hypothetical protein HYV47_03425 [Candidatus Nealsonbacteria bacterium]|nr:hypothetical protein [Candidatus Nealsonbacteria bacterium]